MSAPLEDGSHHLARAPEGTFASSAGLREENERLRRELEESRALNGQSVCAWCGFVTTKEPSAMVDHQLSCEKRKCTYEAVAKAAMEEAGQLRAQKDGAYAERNQVVAFLARMAFARGWLVGVGQHQGAEWEDDWRTLVFINIPDVGQVSWHFHDSERHLLDGLPEYPTGWDGHSTEEKYRRVNTALRLGGGR